VKHVLAAALLLAGCGGDDDSCDVLFGRPNEMTGLTEEQCAPRCACSGFAAPEYGMEDVEVLLTWTELDPPGLLEADPYEGTAPPAGDPDEVCAVVRAEGMTYRVQTFAGEADATAAGATVTHFGACGLCSSLANLAVYMRYLDLTEPVRACGLEYPNGPPEDHIACLEALGFEPACAQIWYFNTRHTREACLAECLLAIDEPYHNADGTLNDCLLCDEVQSGPVFKAIAGRTRRNTGIANAMCRPCDEVRPLVHDY
jgi:hypothetical protein